jgi:hypothetical protein
MASTFEFARSVNQRIGKVLRNVDAVLASRRAQVEVPGLQPWRASAEVADVVGSVLEGLGIDRWTVEPRRTRVTIWAVRASDWPRVLGALVARLGGRGYQLTLKSPESQKVVALRDGLSTAKLPLPSTVTVSRLIHDLSSGLVSQDAAACDIQLWEEGPERTLQSLDRTGVVQKVSDEGRVETVPVPRWDGTLLPKPVAAAERDASEIDFDVDAVYLWVDDSDPGWRARREEVRRRLGLGAPTDALAAHRFRDRGELRASFRSLEMYAPWIRNIYLVTDQQSPGWLDRTSSRVKVVDHRDIFTDPSVLPCYNSHAISSQLHHIDGLSSRYLLMNDDVMFNQPVTPYEFFTADGLLRITLSRSRLPVLDPGRLTDLERARANSAALIQRDHGRRVTQLFAHVPVPQSLEVAREVEEVYASEIAQTLAHPFRLPDDYVVNSWLHLYRALYTGRAVLSPLRFGYYDVGLPATRKLMDDRTLQSRAYVICVNDVQVDDAEQASLWLTDWLARRFPVPTDYELPTR